MLTKLISFANIGLKSERITVEVGLNPGESKICIVGLGDTAVHESKQRVRLALRTSNFRIPSGQFMTVNLAPADIKKVGPRYDLPIALGLLLAHKLVDIEPKLLESTAVLGELALDGSLRHVSGVLSAALACREQGIQSIIVPTPNGPEAALVPGLNVIAIDSLTHLVSVLTGDRLPEPISPPASSPVHSMSFVDFADVRGQEHAKRALTIAAAGSHNVLLSGAPGSGKTLLARALRGILPPLDYEEAIEVTQIYSVANLLPEHSSLLQERPFRMVHHTASGVSIVGGGQVPGPGEISLAHRGVLFLDEFAEFPTQVLEVLRQPLEDRSITITRAQGSVTFPADFLLVAAMNPPQYCAGGANRIEKRISAPLLDRIDLTIDVQPVPIEDLQKPREGATTSAELLSMVTQARLLQRDRFKEFGISTNKEMNVRHIRQFCDLSTACEGLLKQAVTRLGLSARSYHRTIKVARTIADLAGSTTIEPTHIAEALQYRQSVGIGAVV